MEKKSKRMSWVQIVNAVIQAVVAALTALGVRVVTLLFTLAYETKPIDET